MNRSRYIAKMGGANIIYCADELNSSKISFNDKKKIFKKYIKKSLERFLAKDLISDGLFDSIIEKIKQDNGDSRYILISGQYVASKVRAALMKNNTAIIKNDLDIFVLQRHVNRNDIFLRESVTTGYLGTIDTKSPYRINSSNYHNSKFRTKLNIIEVSYEKSSSCLDTANNSDEFIQKFSKYILTDIVESFDINSVKCGITYDLVDEVFDFIISDDFVEFMLNGILRVNSYTNWFGSFPRIMKKLVEFGNVDYVQPTITDNKENNPPVLRKRIDKVFAELIAIVHPKTYKEIGIISAAMFTDINNSDEIIEYYDLLLAAEKMILDVDKNFYDFSDIRLVGFSVNHKLYQVYSEHMYRFLTNNNFKFIPTIPSKNKLDIITVISKDNIDISKLDNTILLKDFLEELIENRRKYQVDYLVHIIREITKVEILSKKISQKKIKKIKEYIFNNICDKSTGFIALMNIIKYNAVNIPLNYLKVLNLTHEHTEADMLYDFMLSVLSYDKTLEIMHNLEQIRLSAIKELKIDNPIIKEFAKYESIPKYYNSFGEGYFCKLFMKLFEIKYDSANTDEIYEFAKNSISNVLKGIIKLKNEELLPKGFANIQITEQNAILKELDTSLDLRLEGHIMRHCVGGYDRSVKRGDSSIFSIKHNSDSSFRYTCEVNPETYAVVQVRGFSNKSVEPEHQELVDKLIDRCIKEMKNQERNKIVEKMHQNDQIFEENRQPRIAPQCCVPNILDVADEENPF